MSMELRQSVSVQQRQEIRLSHEQRLAIAEQQLGLRLELVGALHDEQYTPRGDCPSCAHKMTPAEIVRGFNAEPTDFTTGCPKCRYRFEVKLICFGRGSQMELPFYCASQVLHQLGALKALTPEAISRSHPAVYRSSIVHHGTLRQAFAKLGISYLFPEQVEWQSKVRPFLGRMPDTVIAECADVGVRVIRRLRRELDVEPFSKRRVAEDL